MVILLGTDIKRRKRYFEEAVTQYGMEFKYYSWDQYNELLSYKDIKNSVLKIDAPKIDTSDIGELEMLVSNYIEKLIYLESLPFKAFLNKPQDIIKLLDKRQCKYVLMKNDLAVTHMYDIRVNNANELLSYMADNRISQVFIKPVIGSGAAGVTALRYAAKRNKLVIYTCALYRDGKLYNTKKLRRIEDREALVLIDELLCLDCIVEKWHTKAKHEGYNYDLRVIIQDGEIDFVQPRLSKGPITNLHLNNHTVSFESLKLDEDVIQDVWEICKKAATCFDGLSSIGIDVLIDGRKKPYIVEMNAQGDLMHKDIENDNKIYKHQAEIIKRIEKV